MEQKAQEMNFKMENNINIKFNEALKKMIDDAIQEEIDNEVNMVRLIEEKHKGEPGIINLKYNNTQSASDLIDEVSAEEAEKDNITRIVWNNHVPEFIVPPAPSLWDRVISPVLAEQNNNNNQEEDQDYEDEGGELPDVSIDDSPEQISKIAWNNHDGLNRNHFLGPEITFKREEIKNDLEDDEEDYEEDYKDEEYNEKYTMECIHLNGDDDEVYIYPIDDDQDICLCKQCNMTLAGKILEQMAIETFM